MNTMFLRPTGRARRQWLQGAALALATPWVGPSLAQPTAAQAASASKAGGGLGAPGHYLLRGGHVLTMDPAWPDLPVGDVWVRDGVIVAVGQGLQAPGAEVVDTRQMLVMPGFVDGHSHLWNNFLRGSVRGDDPAWGYFAVTNRAGPLCTPQDAYRSVRFGLAEGLMSGVTTVNNYSHNTASPAHADAEIEAMLSTGVRGRFSYGTPAFQLAALLGAPVTAPALDLADVARVQAQWLQGQPLLTLGVNLQLPPAKVLAERGDAAGFVAQFKGAQKLGLPVSLHYGKHAFGLVGLLQRQGLLGPDLLLIHPQGFSAPERRALVQAGVNFSVSPAIELPYSVARNGYIQFDELEALGAQLSLSIDSASASATADYFVLLRGLLWAHKQRTDRLVKLTPKRIIEIATLEGAKALGLGAVTGSLTPGKQADILLVRRTDMNMAPVFDPYYSLVYSGAPSNVDSVMVAGRFLRRQGRFTHLDADAVLADMLQSAQRLDAELHAQEGGAS